MCERDGVILVGIIGSEIYEVIDASVPFVEPIVPIVAFGENLPLVPIGSPKGSQSHSHTYEDTLAMTMDTKKQPFNTDDNTDAETDP